MQAQDTALHPTAFKVLHTVQTTEAQALNYREWIADEAGLPDSTTLRWLHRLEEDGFLRRDKKDWIWGDRKIYWELTWRGEAVLAQQPSEGEA